MDKETLWSKLESIVGAHGLDIFDIEMPASHAGFLRLYITRASKDGEPVSGKGLSVNLSDCAKVSKEILNHPEVEDMIPGDCQLEVSSPGINRKLTRLEHFKQAVGERLKLVVKNEGQKKEVFRGVLLAFDGKQVEIDDEIKKSKQVLDFKSISDARVDFNF